MAANQFLYGIPRPKGRAKEIPTSSTVAFTNQLSALVAQTSKTTTAATTVARSRPSKVRSSIFSTHNKNTKKRALADIANDNEDNGVPATPTAPSSRKLKLSTRDPLSIVDSSTLQRSKRKLEEKARIYASMKRGDYIPPTNSTTAQVRDANLLVDFDRKWAEAGQPSGFMSSSSSSDSDSDSTNSTTDPTTTKFVTYEDEFGRQRQGTHAEARREERRRAAQAHAAETLQELSARPAPPPIIIRGDVIQSAAFNPDAKMEEMAARRDRSLTPPPEVHYDANSEIRSKGVGFYAFSRDGGERSREMDALRRERSKTERGRKKAAEAEAEAREVGPEMEVENKIPPSTTAADETNHHNPHLPPPTTTTPTTTTTKTHDPFAPPPDQQPQLTSQITSQETEIKAATKFLDSLF